MQASNDGTLDAIVSIQCQLLARGWAVREGHVIRVQDFRVIQWAIACLERAGRPTDETLEELSRIDPVYHWNWLRQRLPNPTPECNQAIASVVPARR